MNLLSDLTSEVAVAILMEKKNYEKIDTTDAANLIGKVFEILESVSVSERRKLTFPGTQDKTVVSH